MDLSAIERKERRDHLMRNWASRTWRTARPTRFREESGDGSRSHGRSRSRPKFILLDEPFAGIDPLAVQDIQGIISLLKSKGIGILITDHNVRETLAITDRAYIISEGKIIEAGTAAEITASPRVRQFYLGEGFRL